MNKKKTASIHHIRHKEWESKKRREIYFNIFSSFGLDFDYFYDTYDSYELLVIMTKHRESDGFSSLIPCDSRRDKHRYITVTSDDPIRVWNLFTCDTAIEFLEERQVEILEDSEITKKTIQEIKKLKKKQVEALHASCIL